MLMGFWSVLSPVKSGLLEICSWLKEGQACEVFYHGSAEWELPPSLEGRSKGNIQFAYFLCISEEGEDKTPYNFS